MEKAFSQRRRAQHAHGDATGRLAENRHLLGIATKRGDVLLHPSQHGGHVHHAVVAGRVVAGFLGQFRMGVETKNPEPVIHAHHHDAFGRQYLAILPRFGSCAGLKATPVDPHHHRQLVVRGFGRRPDVQV